MRTPEQKQAILDGLQAFCLEHNVEIYALGEGLSTFEIQGLEDEGELVASLTLISPDEVV